MVAVPLLIVDDLGMGKLPHTAAEDLRELVVRRCEPRINDPHWMAASWPVYAAKILPPSASTADSGDRK